LGVGSGRLRTERVAVAHATRAPPAVLKGISGAEKRRPQSVQRLRHGRGCTRGHAYFGGRATGKTFAFIHFKAAEWRQCRPGGISHHRRGGRPAQVDAKNGLGTRWLPGSSAGGCIIFAARVLVLGSSGVRLLHGWNRRQPGRPTYPSTPSRWLAAIVWGEPRGKQSSFLTSMDRVSI